jgi:hypothetical protein
VTYCLGGCLRLCRDLLNPRSLGFRLGHKWPQVPVIHRLIGHETGTRWPVGSMTVETGVVAERSLSDPTSMVGARPSFELLDDVRAEPAPPGPPGGGWPDNEIAGSQAICMDAAA